MSDKRQNFVRAKHYSEDLVEVTDKVKCSICKKFYDKADLELVLTRQGKKQYICEKCLTKDNENYF